ncbi:uncharacterized protein RSE6_01658 [Rhynchosporium secalis]|uniref:GPI-anchored protein n=1 Tax=Rhynchosporium secalis TaxID=38038 RepID=A0A1E1LYA3_RHYSE|nr:uncharacterized protein RSE6_01658 [Rhynchosporium secalis]
MRSSTTIATFIFLLLPVSSLQIPSISAPFDSPQFENTILLSNDTLSPPPPQRNELLKKRDGSCPANFNSCRAFRDSAGGACCTVGSICTTDKAKNIACCPTGAVCTGTLNVAPAATTGPGGGGGGAVFGTNLATTTPTITSNTPTITAAPAGPVSYVPNAFFPFPYIPTTYANSALCNSAFQACQTNYAACTAALDGSSPNQGGGFGVTIVAPNGGVTATPTMQNVGVASATSICSSLSAQGCYQIQSDNCAQFGTGTENGFQAGITPGNGAARPRATGGCVAVGVMAAGLGMGMQMM